MRIFALLLLLALGMAGCDKGQSKKTEDKVVLNQETLNEIANTLDIQYTIVANNAGGGCEPDWGTSPCFISHIDISTPNEIELDGWSIYFSQADLMAKATHPEFNVTHINGDLYEISLTDLYKGFTAGETKQIRLVSKGLNLTDAKVMPNYYVAADGLKGVTVKSTKLFTARDTGLEVRPYATMVDGETQFQRGPSDKTPLATTSFLYGENEDTELLESAILTGIVPAPEKVQVLGGTLDITKGVSVQGNPDARGAAFAALNRLDRLGVYQSDEGVPLRLEIAPSRSMREGAYQLWVADKGISVIGVDAAGVANGLQSVASLVTLGVDSLPLVKINDEPRYPFRGMHIDVARNFHSKKFILKLLDQMAAYKLNKLHLHLGDDEGWRLEIRDLPELTDIGGFRCHDLEENTCLIPQLGAGPDPEENPEVNGYYSVTEYKEILREASARHIQVIPSFDMPGHSRALIKAMEVRYRRFMAEGNPEEANRYRLIDPEDTTKYLSIQHYNDNTINVCIESTYVFLDKVMKEMMAVHTEAGHPLTRYHIGADETAGAWVESPACRAFMEKNDIHDVKHLPAYFIERVSQMLADKGIEVAGWNDGMGHTNFAKMPKVVQSNIWDVLPWAGVGNVNKQVNYGWQVVLSTPDALYFDFPHEADPKEPGYYWAARRINTRKVFNFMPDNLPVHAEIWKGPHENEFSIDDSFKRDDDGKVTQRPMQRGKSVIGIQGQLWSETIRSDDWSEYQIYPRMIAVAERAWAKRSWEVPYNYEGAVYHKDSGFFTEKHMTQRDADWRRFATLLGKKELIKLDADEIFYRIPTVGAKIEYGMLKANIIFPGIPIEYRIGSGEWQRYLTPVKLDIKAGEKTNIRVRATSADGKRMGRLLEVR